MNIFTDMLVEQPILLDSQEDGKTRVRFKATQANVINDNARLYPSNVMKDAQERSNTLIAENRMIGESPHPRHYAGKMGQVVFDTKLENSVIKIYNQFMDDQGVVYVDAEVLDTAKGKDLKALVDAKIPVGISMRALGDSVRKQINGVMVDVATKLDIQSYDVVMNPATPGCEIVEVLTDSQMEEILKQQPIQDGATITDPSCPDCHIAMQPQDPDGDGDVDFYSCPTCNNCYVADEYQSVSTNATQTLRKVSLADSDWEGREMARQFMMQKKSGRMPGMTDDVEKPNGKNEEEDIMNPEQILAAIKDSEEFKALVSEQAKAIAQPALDAIEADKQAKAAAEALATQKAEAKAFVDSKVEELKGKMPEEFVNLVLDNVKEAVSKETAGAVIDSMVAIYSKTASKANLDSVSFTGAGQSAGDVRVQVVNEKSPWSKQVHEVLDSFDRIGEEFGHQPDMSIRKANQKFIGEIMKKFENQVGHEAMKDSVAMVDSVMQDSISVSTVQLLNQPTIQQAILIQSFQDVESLQFMASETFDGSEVRWPSETFTSAATIDPTTGIEDMLIGEGVGIPESSINLAWLTYNPQFRRNAISLSTDVVKVLQSGPAKYDAVSRGLYHIAFDKRRKLDNLAYLEMVMASDEYSPNVVESEVATGAGSAVGNITAVNNGTNVTYKYNIRAGADATAGSNPIVRPRTKKQILPTGAVQTVVTNAFTVKVGGTALQMGYMDATGNVRAGAYAVDFENGVVYFTADAGLSGSALPTLSFSAVTNYTRWAVTPGAGVAPEQHYNSLLQMITGQVQLMGSAPRFNKPNLGIMSLNASQYIENAAMWYKLNSPELGSLNGGGTSNFFGSRSGVNFNRINAPWVAGDNRILLTQKGATRYAIETPYQIEGPYPKYDANGQIVDAKIYYGRENSVLATPQTIDAAGSILNPKSRSIKLV